MSQETQILNHLKKGPITPMQAMKLYNIYRLAARISDLRYKGHKIRTQTMHRNGKHYARYWLETN